MSFKASILLVIFAILSNAMLFSCTTQFKKAQNLIEEKNYDEALAILEKLVQNDPNDADYQVGLKQARLGVIDQSLIRVRMTRLADNNQESLEILRNTIERQNQWSLFPSGAVAFTQNEEINEAFYTLQRETKSLLEQKKYIRVLYITERYKILFGEERKKAFNKSYQLAKNKTADFCQQKSNTLNKSTFYYNRLIAKLCKYVDSKIYIPKSEPELFKDIEINLTDMFQTPLPAELMNTFKNKMSVEFSRTGWKQTDAKQNLKIMASGKYHYSQNTYRTLRTHTYYEKDPNSTTNPPAQIARHYNYFVATTDQAVSAQLTLASSNTSVNSYTGSFNQNNSFTEHNYYNPQISLYPDKSGRSIDEREWLNVTAQYFVDQYTNQLKNNFKTLYCDTLNESIPTPQLLNTAVMCLKQEKPNEIIQKAFLKEYQINATEMETLFKVAD